MIVRLAGGVMIAGVIGLMTSDAGAAQQMTCQQIVAVRSFAGGKMSADELAKKLNTDPETVRNCLDKKPQEAAKGQPPATGATPPAAATPPPAATQ
jgi:hypothetical protein